MSSSTFANEPVVRLVCTLDNTTYELPLPAARVSRTISDLIEDAGVDAVIPLEQNTPGPLFSKVAAWCRQYAASDNVGSIEYDLEFCNVDMPTKLALIEVVNYLDIRPLLNLLCNSVAFATKGRSPEELRALFGRKEPFAPEERAQAAASQGWENGEK